MSVDEKRSARVLRRIADALGTPVEALIMPRGVDPASPGHSPPSPAEINTLLAAFLQLKDGQARRRVIAAAEAEVRHADNSTDGVAHDGGDP